MRARRRRRIVGLLPRLVRGLWLGGRWLTRHPQLLVVPVSLVLAGWTVWRAVNHLEAFRITRIQAVASSLKLPDSLIGANIWQVDIHTLAEQLHRQQPWLKEVRVIRDLPDGLRVETVERIPIAQVHLAQWHPVDLDGYILPQGQPRPAGGLVRFVGIDSPQEPLRAGQANASERLQLALRVVGLTRRSRVLAARPLTVVDVSDPRQISFIVDDTTEVRCGSEQELTDQLSRLGAALERIRRQQLDVRYIDVRFPEPVISPRT